MKAKHVLALAVVAVSLAGCRAKQPAETDLLNTAAKLPAGLPVDPLGWRVVTTVVDRAQGTTATLTANEQALPFAGTGEYPAGSELALVTWAEREDPHWFGARIPGEFVRLELVTVKAGADGKTSQEYRVFEGAPAREIALSGDGERRFIGHKAAILKMRAAEMP
jgi:hypothetical protein